MSLDEEVYQSDVDDDDDLDDDYSVEQLPIGSWQTLAVLSVTKSAHPKKEDLEEGQEQQRVVNAQLMVVENDEFNGRRIFPSWFMGTRSNPNVINREDFQAFFKAITGETLAKGSQPDFDSLAGTEDEPVLVRAQIADASYKDKKSGEVQREGQVKIKNKSWKPYTGNED